MRSKNLIVLCLLATALICGSFITSVAAQENQIYPAHPTMDLPDPPDAALIAPSPDDNSTSNDENTTAPINAPASGSEDASLLAAQEGKVADNTMAIGAIVLLSVVVFAGAVGAVHYRRKASKDQI